MGPRWHAPVFHGESFLRILAGLSALAIAPVFCAADQPDAKRPLIWAADAEGGAPYILKNPKNPHANIGFEVDLAAALAQELGRPIRFKQYEFSSLFSGLDRGDFDFAMNGLEITPDRQRKCTSANPTTCTSSSS